MSLPRDTRALIEPLIKVCGVRSFDVALASIQAGATALGFNFVKSSRRFIAPAEAHELVARLRSATPTGPQTLMIGVFADASPDEISRIRETVGLDLVQLHGHETPKDVEGAAPAFKALRIGSEEDLPAIATMPGPFVLVDARVRGMLGGTGVRIPFKLVQSACALRQVVVAGGLTAENVGQVVPAGPIGVDTASGAEDGEGAPSAAAASAFVRAARLAFEARET